MFIEVSDQQACNNGKYDKLTINVNSIAVYYSNAPNDGSGGCYGTVMKVSHAPQYLLAESKEEIDILIANALGGRSESIVDVTCYENNPDKSLLSDN